MATKDLKVTLISSTDVRRIKAMYAKNEVERKRAESIHTSLSAYEIC